MTMRGFFLAVFRNRRRITRPVPVNRRKGWSTQRDAERSERESLDRFEQAIGRHRDKIDRREVANDVQQVVLWHTFYPGCSFNKSGDAAIRLCTNPLHAEARNDAPAYCDEESCPIMRGLSAA